MVAASGLLSNTLSGDLECSLKPPQGDQIREGSSPGWLSLPDLGGHADSDSDQLLSLQRRGSGPGKAADPAMSQGHPGGA